jgi:hypothetical protein
MSQCRFPFMCDTAGCDRCAVPVIVIPPEIEPLRTKLAMLCFAGALLSVLAIFTLAFPDAFERATRAHQEDIV